MVKEGVPAYPRSAAANRRTAGRADAPPSCAHDLRGVVLRRCSVRVVRRTSGLPVHPKGNPLPGSPPYTGFSFVAPATDVEGSAGPANVRVALMLPIVTTKEA